MRTITIGAAGAAIGAIAGGGVGALIGAGAGGAAGLAVSAQSHQTLKVKPETRLVFTLRRPVPLEELVPAPRPDEAAEVDKEGER